LNEHLLQAAAKLQIELEVRNHPARRLSALLKWAHTSYGKVVVLIDEYDRPLVRDVENSGIVIENRSLLEDFFAILKSHQRYLRFVFVTGMAKLSRGSLPAGVDSLFDISSAAPYATLVGLTEEKIAQQFKPRIEHLAAGQNVSLERVFSDVRGWCPGHCFASPPETERVYDPWSLLNFLRFGELKDY
jgi:hypothetical protein